MRCSLGLAALILTLVVGAAPAQAIDNQFTGATNGDWSTATNWSQGHVPLATEDVKIDVNNKNPTLSTADGVANSITLAPTTNDLFIDGHTLTVGSGTSSIAGPVVKVTGGGTLHLGGPTTWSAGNWQVDGTSTYEVANTLSIAGDLVFNSVNSAGGQLHVLSGGTLQKTAGSGIAQIAEKLDNDGTVSVQSGELQLGGGDTGTTTGGFAVSSGATLHVAGNGTNTIPSLTGAGTFHLSTGQVITSGSTFTIPTVNQDGGEWKVNANISVPTYTTTGGERDGSGTLTITSASTLSALTMHDVGTTTVAGTASTSTLAGSGSKALDGHTLNLNANTTMSSGQFGIDGTSAVNVGALLSIAGDFSAFGTFNSVGGQVHVLGSGTLQKTTGSGTGSVDVPTTSAGTVTLSAGTLNFPGTLTENGGVVNVPASRTLGGPVTVAGGTLKGAGTLSGSVTNSGGTVAPGSSPGKLTVSGDYTQGPGGTMQEEITGTTQDTQYDHLVVGGNLSLDGTLAIQSNAFTPAPTDTFKIISGAASRTGTFAALTGASFSGGSYSAQYDTDGATLTVAAAPPPPPPAPPPPPPPPPAPVSTPAPASPPAVPAVSPDVSVAAATPACLSIPAVIRHQTAPVRGGGRVQLLTNQIDDPARPLHANVRFAGRGAIKTVVFTANGRALTADVRGFATAVPIGSLRIGRGRNALTAKVTLRDGRKITVVQFFEVQRCPLPSVSCQRLADGHSLRCTGGTPLRARKVKVTVIHSASQTARGTASVTRGRYTVTVRSSVPLPSGRYAYKYVATTAKRGQNFQVIRLVTVT